MHKWSASTQGKTTPSSKVQGGKRSKWPSPDEEAQKIPVVIIADSLEQASNALSALEGATQDASKEAYASLEDGALAGGPPNAYQVVSEAPSTETIVGSPLQARRSSLTTFDACKARLLDRLVLGLYVKPMEWARPSMDTSAPSPDAAQSIIDLWNPFKKRDSSVTHMHKLYPNNLLIPMVAHVEKYSIPFSSYMDKKSY